MGVLQRELLLMHYLRHFSSTIIWIFCIVKACHTPTPPLLFGAILRILTETARLAICVPREVH